MSMSRMAPVDSLAGSTAVHSATATVAAPGRAVLAIPHRAAVNGDAAEARATLQRCQQKTPNLD